MLAIRNIGELFLGDGRSLRNAQLRIEDGRILDFGADGEEFLDARGGAVIPGLIDSHTHLVFAGDRCDEFVMRAKGMSYLEIAKAGGGISRTVDAVRKASLDDLVALALPRLARMLSYGVTTVEVKSGYGLTVEDEIKMLLAVRKLQELQPVELVPTYLAAHAVPPEFRDRREAYVDLVVSDELMGRVAEEGLAELVDVFCEESAFTVPESRRILEAGKKRGLAPRIHADQITQMGASRLAAEVGCVSADHLERIDEGGIAAMRSAGVIAGLLPGCSFYLGVSQAPARKLLDAGVPVAFATNYNPGSSMVESLPLVLSIACTQMNVTPSEALAGATGTAAKALLRGNRLGRIEKGMDADLVVLDVESIDQWLSEMGRGPVRTVLKRGRVVHESPRS
ncbi:MAG: imidazolonepropionase [Vicinamibacteria bacterium]